MNGLFRKHSRSYGSGRPINEVTARGLGWFSIGLGAAEILAPRLLGRALGMPHSGGLLFLYGLREVATGIGLLRAKNRTPWLWGRVAGDALDLATLAAHVRPNNKLNIGMGMAAVAGVTAIDVTMAQAMAERDKRRARDWVDYSDRSGFPQSAAAARGIARKDFTAPQDMRAPAVERELELT